MVSMELILVRHGQSQNNATRSGILNSPLTELGHQQAESAGKVVASLKPEVLASSSLQRALQTAAASAKLLDLPIEVWNNAHEIRLEPGYDGLDINEMNERFPQAIFDNKDMNNNRWKYVSDQNIDLARERAAKLIDNLQKKYAGKRIAIFLHGHLNRMIMQSLLGPSTFEKIYIRQPNACINRIEFKDDKIHISGMSDVNHLIQDGIKIT